MVTRARTVTVVAAAVAAAVGTITAGSVLGAPPAAASTAASQVLATVAGDGATGVLATGVSGTSTPLGSPVGVAADAQGNILIADQNNNVVRVVAASSGTAYGKAMSAGHIYTIVGDGNSGYAGDGVAEPLTSVELSDPNGVAVDPQGDIAITDSGNDAVRLVSAISGFRYGTFMSAGQIYTIAGGGTPGTIADGGQATSAGLDTPDGVAFDSHGDVVVADTNNDVVRFVPQNAGTYYGRAMQPAHIYTLAGTTVYGYTGDGGPARVAEISIEPFAGVAVDPSGNVAFADADNMVIRVVAAVTGQYDGRTVQAGSIYTIAGNGTEGYSGNKKPATRAELDTPQGVAFDASGNLYIGDSYNNMVRLVPAVAGSFSGKAVKPGKIYTIAGNGNAGDTGNGGPATAGTLNGPAGVSVTPSGHVVIADNGNNVIREITDPFPAVRAVKARSGPSSGGRKVVIVGSNLAGATSVLFGPQRAAIVSRSYKRVVVLSPASAPGTVVVVVNTPSGPSVAGPGDSYTFLVAAVPATKHRH